MKMMPYFKGAFLLVTLTTLTTITALATPKSVFILAGQSNMVGQGGVENGALSPDDKWDGIIPAECESNPSVLRLNEVTKKWEEAHEPLQGRGVGPGMAFSNSLLKRDPSIGVIGLVPCAVSGSPIVDWSASSKNYNDMLALAREATTVANGGVLRGFLWYQGESDTQRDANLYQRRVVDLFNRVRADLHSPSLPIIHVALASGFNYTETVRQAQLHVDLPNLKCVDAYGLELQPPFCNNKPIVNPRDCLHLSTPAQVQLGIKLADAFLSSGSLHAVLVNALVLLSMGHCLYLLMLWYCKFRFN